jgi:demethylmenaquinone methyltransferase/2-methoxy-6-polyprenyl-1,4-benzoquinol methylase
MPLKVLDVATGTTAVAREIVRQTGARVVGLDQSEPMLRGGLQALQRQGISDRVSLVLGQAERLPFPDESFDALSFTYLLRYVDDPAATLEELARVVRPGGVVAGLEFHIPPAMWRPAWLLYTRGVMPVVGAVVSPWWRYTGSFLGRSVSRFYDEYPPEEQGAMWRGAGLRTVRFRTMTLGGGIVIWGEKSG